MATISEHREIFLEFFSGGKGRVLETWGHHTQIGFQRLLAFDEKIHGISRDIFAIKVAAYILASSSPRVSEELFGV